MKKHKHVFKHTPGSFLMKCRYCDSQKHEITGVVFIGKYRNQKMV